MPAAISQTALIIHDIACQKENCALGDHEDVITYIKAAQSIAAIYEIPSNEPKWLSDRKLVQHTSLTLILDETAEIKSQLDRLSTMIGGQL